MRQLLVSFILLMNLCGQAQQHRFVFIQSQPGNPFYVRMDDKTFSSNSFGYLVLAPLTDSAYHLHIGLPKNQVPEQEFVLDVKGKDRGFELKRASDNGLRLYDWQTMQFLDPVSQPEKAEQAGTPKTDAYSRLMAGVVNDPAVAMVYKPEPAAQTKSEPVQAESKNTVLTDEKSGNSPDIPVKDTSVKAFASNQPLYKVKDSSTKAVEGATAGTVMAVESKDTVSKSSQTGDNSPDTVARVVSAGSSSTDAPRDSASSKPATSSPDTVLTVARPEKKNTEPTIQKLTDDSVGGGRKLVFSDRSAGITDTVEVLIEEEGAVPAQSAVSATENSDSTDIKQSPGKQNEEAPKQSIPNSNCVKFASDADVDKLRVLMLKENNEDERIFQARKAFKTRCFTTHQVRGLSELFGSDEGRYKFFDAAYPFVSDSGNFGSLLELLTDPYYINRFKAMVRLQD